MGGTINGNPNGSTPIQGPSAFTYNVSELSGAGGGAGLSSSGGGGAAGDLEISSSILRNSGVIDLSGGYGVHGGGYGGAGRVFLFFKPVLNLTLNGKDNQNTSIIYGTPSNFTAKVSNPDSYVDIYVNGTLEGEAKGTYSFVSALQAGLYKVTVMSRGTGVANITYYERVLKASPTITLSASLANFTYNGTAENFSGGINTINGQLVAEMYVDGRLSKSTMSGVWYATAASGNYTVVINTSGNQNYSAASSEVIRQIYPAVVKLYLNGLLDADSEIIYGTSSNVSVSVQKPNVSIGLVLDGVLVANLSGNNITFIKTLSAGVHTITVFTNSTNFQNITYKQTVQKAAPYLSLSLINRTVYASVYSYLNQLNGNLKIDNVSNWNDSDVFTYVVPDNLSSINVTLATVGNMNYTQSSKSIEVVFGKDFNDTQQILRLQGLLYQCSSQLNSLNSEISRLSSTNNALNYEISRYEIELTSLSAGVSSPAISCANDSRSNSSTNSSIEPLQQPSLSFACEPALGLPVGGYSLVNITNASGNTSYLLSGYNGSLRLIVYTRNGSTSIIIGNTPPKPPVGFWASLYNYAVSGMLYVPRLVISVFGGL